MAPDDPTAPAFQAAIFDMDGTLADTEPLHQQAWQRFAAERGRDLSAADYYRLMAGRPGLAILAEQFDLRGGAAQAALASVQEHFWRIAGGELRPLAGLLATLDRISHWPIAVATSELRAVALRRLRLIGVHERFPVVVCAEDVSRPKPDPEVFLAAAARLGAPPEACLVFEDSLSGTRAARAAGMYCVGLSTTHAPAALAAAQLVIADYTDPRLAGLLGGRGPAPGTPVAGRSAP